MRDAGANDADAMGSRASDAGSVKGDSASEAGSEHTSISAGTLASGASTAFLSQQVHSFTLDDFAGHEIQTILEDGETDQHQNDQHHDGQSQDGQQSVRPGSIVSNIEQRLDELDGLGPAEPSTREADEPSASTEEPSGGGGTSAGAAQEAQYLRLLQQMQHRDLTPEDLQLLMRIEKERAERHRGGKVPAPSLRPEAASWNGAEPAPGSWASNASSSSSWDAGGISPPTSMNGGAGTTPPPTHDSSSS